MDDQPAPTRIANAFAPWVPIGGTIVGVMSFFILVGMWLGPQKDVPAQLATILARLNEINSRVDKMDWAMDALKSTTQALGMQQSVEVMERNKLADSVRDIKNIITRLESTAVTREVFTEWKSDLERRNRNLSTPALTKPPS